MLTVELAAVEALLDEGYDHAEAAQELGCDVATIERTLGLDTAKEVLVEAEAAAAAVPKEELFTTNRVRTQSELRGGAPKTGPEMSLASMTKLDKTLVSFTTEDNALMRLCDDMNAAGRPASVKVRGRQVSRSGLARLIADQMSLLRLKTPLYQATGTQQKAIVGLAILAVEALEAVEREAKD